MSADSKILLRNGVLTTVCLAVMVAALFTTSINEATRKAVIGSALAYVVGLWTHSGRQRGDDDPGAPGLSGLPVLCLAVLAFGACEMRGGSLRLGPPAPVVYDARGPVARLGDEYAAQAKLIADSIEMTTAAAPTFTSGRAGIYALNTDGLLYTQDANGLALKLHAAQSFRTSANCSGLSSPANGDVCYDTTLSAPRFYAGGWATFPTDSLVVHLAGTETITGAKTFNANVAMATTKTLTVGSNVLIGSVADKLNAAYLAIASQAAQDILVADSTSTFARKAVGSEGQRLSVVSGAVAWATVPYATVSGGETGTIGAATRYLVAPGQAPSATEYYLAVVTRATTSANLYCYLGVAPGGSDTVAVTVRENGSDQALTCTITGAAQSCSDTSNSFASVAGDRLSVKAVSSAGTAADLTCSFEER